MSERRGDSIRTHLGEYFYPLDPRVEEIHIGDIAHALANLCRFTGHTRVFYSVAEHSVRVSWAVSRQYALWGLLHDASEAYLVDVPRPLKRLPEFAEYRIAEQRLMRAICERFRLPPDEPAPVKFYDSVLLATEKRDLMPPSTRNEEHANPPLEEKIEPWDPRGAKNAFLACFAELEVNRG